LFRAVRVVKTGEPWLRFFELGQAQPQPSSSFHAGVGDGNLYGNPSTMTFLRATSMLYYGGGVPEEF
jgi:hypothetical protein